MIIHTAGIVAQVESHTVLNGVSVAQTAAGCYCHISSTNQWTVSANACKEPINPNWGWHEGERCRGEGE